MTPRDLAVDLATLTTLLYADGCEPLDLTVTVSPELLDHARTGICFAVLTSPGRTVLLTANWRATHTSTLLAGLPTEAGPASLWRADAANFPVRILAAAARAATAPHADPPTTLLRAAGWQRDPVQHARHGIRAIPWRSPDGERTATATYLHGHGRTERGPWLIERTDLPAASRDQRAHADASPAAPGGVIAALALTD